MSKKTDAGSRPARSERLRGWWFRGVDAEAPPQREDLSNALQTHLDGMAGHARDIERAEAAAEKPQPVLEPVSGPVAANGNGYAGPHALPVA